MMENIKTGFEGAASLGAVGLIVGVIAGWWGLLRADGAEAVAGANVPISLALVPLLPAVLVLLAISNLEDENRVFYTTLGGALGRLLTAGLGGSVLAALLFLVAAFLVPAVFGGEDATQMVEAVRDRLLWDYAALIVAVTTASALGIAAWANRRALRQSLNNDD